MVSLVAWREGAVGFAMGPAAPFLEDLNKKDMMWWDHAVAVK
jgi:hypothetical protein